MNIQTSTTTAKLAKALAAFQKEAHDPVRDSSNPHFKSRFASLAQTVIRNRKVAAGLGLAITQHPIVDEARAGTVIRVDHESGEFMESTLMLPLVKQTPQAVGSAVSYARRYQLNAVLGVAPVDEDDDGEEAAQEYRANSWMLDLFAQMEEAADKQTLESLAGELGSLCETHPPHRAQMAARYKNRLKHLAASGAVAESLDDLLALIKSGAIRDSTSHNITDEPGVVWANFGELPRFGGEGPSDTECVWSWDERRLLVGTCPDDMEIVPREEVAS